MKCVGLTGGIGSGKSTVVKIFSSLNVPVYIADERSKALLNSNSRLKEKLIEAFGPIYQGDKIDKQLFSSIIFNDDDKRELANNIIHPFVKDDFSLWMSEQNANYVIKESAILYEIASEKEFDEIILITSPTNLRIERILKRGDSKIADIKSRMESQWSDEKKLALADFHIKNDGKQSLISQILEIHKKLESI